MVLGKAASRHQNGTHLDEFMICGKSAAALKFNKFYQSQMLYTQVKISVGSFLIFFSLFIFLTNLTDRFGL